MLQLAQRSQDELFHIALYNWLIQADLTEKLLEVNMCFHSLFTVAVGSIHIGIEMCRRE